MNFSCPKQFFLDKIVIIEKLEKQLVILHNKVQTRLKRTYKHILPYAFGRGILAYGLKRATRHSRNKVLEDIFRELGAGLFRPRSLTDDGG